MKRISHIIEIAVIIYGIVITSSCRNDNAVNATGSFEATEITVSSESTGKIEELNIEEGDIIEKDRKVGFTDTIQLSLKKMQLMANRNSVTSQIPDTDKQLAAMKEELRKAEKEKERVSNLIKDEAGTQKQLDDWNSRIAVLKKEINARQSSLDKTTKSLIEQGTSLDIQIAQTEDMIRKCVISSPINGTVLAKYAEAGEIATIGKPLFKIADMNRVYLRAYLTAEQLKDVAIGSEATVHTIFGDYKGKVTWISQEAEFTPKNILTEDEMDNMVYAVKISIKNDGKIKLGMYGTVIF